jgi:LPXTG-motif cell wall-anchored protein
MRRTGHRIACVLAVAALALPGAAWGQSAGDEQYEDPFAPESGQTDDGDDTGSSAGDDTGSSGGGSSGAGSSGGGGAVQPAPAEQPEAVTAPPATTSAAGQELPRTGADTGLLALGGAVLLAGGVALRVTLREREREREPRRR